MDMEFPYLNVSQNVHFSLFHTVYEELAADVFTTSPVCNAGFRFACDKV